MTRSDWNTFPDTVTTLTATDEIKDLMENFQYEKPADAPDVSAFKHKRSSEKPCDIPHNGKAESGAGT